MADEPLPVVYTPEFKRNLRRLSKKYRHIREDNARGGASGLARLGRAWTREENLGL